MRIVRIYGGLGNQMFQYVLYYKFQKKEKLVFIDRSFKSDRSYELDKWKILPREISPLIASIYNNNRNYFWNRVFIYYRGLKKSKYTENPFAFYHDYNNIHNIYFEGYWQNLKYFEDIEPDIRKAFNYHKISLCPRNTVWNDRINKTESVAIHVRAGDYLTPSEIKCYGDICTTAYYEQAIDYIDHCVKNPVYYVFSNDLDYARSILPEREYVFVEGNTEADAIEEMMLMRSCKHQIIANSTFSWWAAWLNDNPEKHVVMPEIWVNGAEPVNLAEDGWKVLKKL